MEVLPTFRRPAEMLAVRQLQQRLRGSKARMPHACLSLSSQSAWWPSLCGGSSHGYHRRRRRRRRRRH